MSFSQGLGISKSCSELPAFITLLHGCLSYSRWGSPSQDSFLKQQLVPPRMPRQGRGAQKPLLREQLKFWHHQPAQLLQHKAWTPQSQHIARQQQRPWPHPLFSSWPSERVGEQPGGISLSQALGRPRGLLAPLQLAVVSIHVHSLIAGAATGVSNSIPHILSRLRSQRDWGQHFWGAGVLRSGAFQEVIALLEDPSRESALSWAGRQTYI